MKKQILTAVAIFSVMFGSTFAADLENIEVVNNGNLVTNTTSDLTLPSWEVSGDLKVLKDYTVSFAYKDTDDSKKVLINLMYSLEKNKSYTIIWVDWAETNMDFSIWDEIKGEYKNEKKPASWLAIEKINLLDGKTMEIYYNQELKAEEFVYKILSEIPTKSKTGDGKNTLSIALSAPLEELTPYIILANSLLDAAGKEVKLKETFYEFETKTNLEFVFEKPVETETATWTGQEAKEDEGNLEKVAMNSAKTPETWATTWILVIITLFLAGAVVLTQKKA